MLSESPKSWFGSSDPIWLRCGNMTSLSSLRCVKDGIEVCGKMHWDATVPFMRTQGVGRGRRWRRCWKKGYLQVLCVLSMCERFCRSAQVDMQLTIGPLHFGIDRILIDGTLDTHGGFLNRRKLWTFNPLNDSPLSMLFKPFNTSWLMPSSLSLQ